MKLSKRERVVLEVLSVATEPLRGSEIVKRSDGRVGRGTIYTDLDHLIEKGLVQEFELPPSPDLNLVGYKHSITDAGREALGAA